MSGDARDFNNIETQAFINFLSPQDKASRMIDQHFSVSSVLSKEFCLLANLFGLLNISFYYSPLTPAAEGNVFCSFPHTI
jgi:hypothetical protein